MRVDPAIIQILAENVRAEVITRPAAIKLDPAVLAKIKEKVPIFRGMVPDCLARTMAIAENHSVKAGQTVFNEGDMGDSFFILIAGEVVIEKGSAGQPFEIARLSAGECFGEMAMVGNSLRSATVRVLRDAVTLRFYRDQVDASPESALVIYRNIARILATRLNESSVILAERLPPKAEA